MQIKMKLEIGDTKNCLNIERRERREWTQLEIKPKHNDVSPRSAIEVLDTYQLNINRPK